MKHLPSFFLLTGLLFIYACANTGSPSGGPKDVTPPRLLKCSPLVNQLNYDAKRVELTFDELVSLENPSEKIIISPPQKQAPTTKTIGNKIVVAFADSMYKNTTYTIDFTDAIVDYNEKNKFGDYSFSFSTGPKIDTFRVAGTLLDASNLNPVSGIIVGVHEDLSDSAFVKKGFRHISKTDKNGFFSIKGIPQKPLRVYALNDKNKDYFFNQPGEEIAYYDSIVRPWTEPCQKVDTVWKDSVTVDSIVKKTVTCYKPDDIVLKYFKEDFGRQYLAKKSRPERNKIEMVFGYKSETMPKLELLNSNSKNWFLPESNMTKDTLTYWITDSLVSSLDTLKLKVDYFKTDSTGQLAPATDTLSLVFRKIHQRQLSSEKAKKDEDVKKEEVSPFNMKVSLAEQMDIFAVPEIQWDSPVKEIKGKPWHLFEKKDSLWREKPFSVDKDSTRLKNYLLKADWNFGGEYRFDVDSGMISNYYGQINKKYSQTFKIRKEEDYSRLILKVSGIQKGFAELLDKSDKVLRKAQIVDGVADFKYLMPGTYYLRAIEDRNGNNKWDTGNYLRKIQPENVYYKPESVNLRANWDVEEEWNVFEKPLQEQKPKALIPKDTQK